VPSLTADSYGIILPKESMVMTLTLARVLTLKTSLEKKSKDPVQAYLGQNAKKPPAEILRLSMNAQRECDPARIRMEVYENQLKLDIANLMEVYKDVLEDVLSMLASLIQVENNSIPAGSEKTVSSLLKERETIQKKLKKYKDSPPSRTPISGSDEHFEAGYPNIVTERITSMMTMEAQRPKDFPTKSAVVSAFSDTAVTNANKSIIDLTAELDKLNEIIREFNGHTMVEICLPFFAVHALKDVLGLSNSEKLSEKFTILDTIFNGLRPQSLYENIVKHFKVPTLKRCIDDMIPYSEILNKPLWEKIKRNADKGLLQREDFDKLRPVSSIGPVDEILKRMEEFVSPEPPAQATVEEAKEEAKEEA